MNDLLEELCGARLTYNYMRIGGVAWDLPPGFVERTLAFLDQFGPMLAEYNDLITDNKIFIGRCDGVAVISAEEAINYNLVGPNLRRREFATTSGATSPTPCIQSLNLTCQWGQERSAQSAIALPGTGCVCR